MTEAPPGSKYKWNVTNLDGSFHKHVKYGGNQQETIQQTGNVVHKDKDTPEINEAKITANLRTEAIAKAHEENMEASEKLRQVIQALVDQLVSIETTMTMFNETIRAYLDAPISKSNAPRDEEYSGHL
jgi:hypothetical protein